MPPALRVLALATAAPVTALGGVLAVCLAVSLTLSARMTSWLVSLRSRAPAASSDPGRREP